MFGKKSHHARKNAKARTKKTAFYQVHNPKLPPHRLFTTPQCPRNRGKINARKCLPVRHTQTTLVLVPLPPSSHPLPPSPSSLSCIVVLPYAPPEPQRIFVVLRVLHLQQRKRSPLLLHVQHREGARPPTRLPVRRLPLHVLLLLLLPLDLHGEAPPDDHHRQLSAPRSPRPQ